MALHIHVSSGFDQEGLASIKHRLKGAVVLTSGPEPMPGTSVWVTGSASLDALDSLPQLKSVIVPWAGVSEKLIEAMQSRPQLSLHNLHHNADATAEMAMALLLAASRQIPRADRQIREGCWGMRFGLPEPVLLHGRTALVLGWGEIGKRVGRICRGLGMKVIGVRRTITKRDPSFVHAFGDLHQLLPRAQALIVTAPLTSETRGMIGAAELALMPPGGLLVNVGRGAIVDEEALFEALKSSHLAAAGIDTWYTYPNGEEPCLPSRFAFHELENVTMSPHRGGAASQVEGERVKHLVRTVQAMTKGDFTRWKVDLERGY